MKRLAVALAFGGLASLAFGAVASAQEGANVTNNQIAVMMLVDYGRNYGYQVMMSRIQQGRDKAQFDKDAALLKQKRALYARKSIPLVELEIAELKDAWNRAQLVVSEKNLAVVQAEYQATVKLAEHFGRQPITAEDLYATFRKGWDAGCEKGPDEVAAAKARVDFMRKLVARSDQLYRQRNESGDIADRKADATGHRRNGIFQPFRFPGVLPQAAVPEPRRRQGDQAVTGRPGI